jgi:phosphate/sulfate permease
MVANVRGAIAYDVARTHGLSLSKDARRILSMTDSQNPRRARILSLATWAASRVLRRIGPLWVLSPTVSAIETFALGHLLDRYLEEARTHHSIRIEAEEALRIRRIIEKSLIQTLSPDTVVPTEGRSGNPPGEDQRDDVTRLVDWALLSTASFPSYVLRRLDAAFDRVLRDLQNSEPQ